MELSLVELWNATGPLARGVVVLLGGMSVAAGAVGVEKVRRLRRAERETAACLAAWRSGATEAEDLARLAGAYPASPVAALLALASGEPPPAAGDDVRREIHDRSVRRHLLATSADLRRGLGVLATVGSTAPFVGLFGTVVGIVNAFHEIGSTGRGGIAVVSTGIAEALVTTAFGILVAIPAVWLFNHLSQRIARLLAAVECAGEELAVARLVAAAPDGRPRAERVPSWR
jgi:biopolymer transport protein ExbB/TolQ